MNLIADFFYPRGCDQIDLGQRHQPMPDTEKPHDFEMLDCLRHDSIVRGHHQNGHVHPRGARYHVLDELFVPGNVDNARRDPRPQQAGSKTQLDRQAAFFLGFQPVGLTTRQEAHQASFAVVDMTRGTDHEQDIGVLILAKETGGPFHWETAARLRTSS